APGPWHARSRPDARPILSEASRARKRRRVSPSGSSPQRRSHATSSKLPRSARSPTSYPRYLRLSPPAPTVQIAVRPAITPARPEVLPFPVTWSAPSPRVTDSSLAGGAVSGHAGDAKSQRSAAFNGKIENDESTSEARGGPWRRRPNERTRDPPRTARADGRTPRRRRRQRG